MSIGKSYCTFGAPDNVDALSSSDPSLHICWAIGAWNHDVWKRPAKTHLLRVARHIEYSSANIVTSKWIQQVK